MFTHRIEVRFRDCDSLGHVNNAVYFTYFEQARVVMGERLGFRCALDRLGLILVHAACDYKAQVVFGDELEVAVGIAALGRTSFTCEFEIRKVDDGTLVSTGHSPSRPSSTTRLNGPRRCRLVSVPRSSVSLAKIRLRANREHHVDPWL